ncbi:MAG: beta-ketoacyl synthase N-terminal-like domain-containing protein [Gemmatimonadota bacterium]
MTSEIWITGIGVVSAAGVGIDPLRTLLLEAGSAVRHDASLGFGMGRVEQFQPVHAARRLDRSAQLFLTAAEAAWADSGLNEDALDPRRCALIEGSSLGPMSDALAEHRRVLESPGRAVKPSRLIRFMTGAGGAVMAQTHRLRGPVLHLSAASVSAMCAIGEACDRIRSGAMDLVIAGGAECPLDPEVLRSFQAAGILAEAGDECRPFDERRSGTVLGEGAGVLILEAANHAERRGARARARLGGFGLACENFSLTGPDPSGAGVADAAAQAMEGATASEIGWIKTHGTGTIINDAAECAGLATLFGDRLPAMPLTSLKAALGHCLGASGAVETVATVLCLEAGIVPATVGTREPDRTLPPCTVATSIRQSRGKKVLLLAESFGGRCVGMVMSA